MKPAAIATLILAVAAVCLLVVASLPRETQAQLQATADGATLEAKARRALTAVTSQSPSALWAEIAPWQQNSIRLDRAQLMAILQRTPEVWQPESAYFKSMNPRNRFTLNGPEDIRALADHEYFGLRAGIYKLEGIEGAAELMSGEWFVIDRKVGIGQSREDSMAREIMILQTIGTVAFQNVEGSTVVVVAVAEGNLWFITDVIWDLAVDSDGEGSIGGILGSGRRTTARVATTSSPGSWRAQRAEGEQILGSMKNMARVHFAKMGTAPDTLSDARVEASHRAGKYYTARDKVWSKGTLTVLAADANDGSGAGVIMIFKMDSGQSRAEHFESKAEMERRIEEVLEEADPLDE